MGSFDNFVALYLRKAALFDLELDLFTLGRRFLDGECN